MTQAEPPRAPLIAVDDALTRAMAREATTQRLDAMRQRRDVGLLRQNIARQRRLMRRGSAPVAA